MIYKKSNRDELIAKILSLGLFLLLFIAINGDNSDDLPLHNDVYLTELSQVNSSAILDSPPVVPELNSLWVVSENSLKFRTDYSLSALISKHENNTEFQVCSKSYLKIKSRTYNLLPSILHSSYEYEEYPPSA